MKRKLFVQNVLSYKEQKLSQYTGKQNYVIKNEENSDYYYLSNRKMIVVVFSFRVSLLSFYFRESFKCTNSSLTEEKDQASSGKVINLGIFFHVERNTAPRFQNQSGRKSWCCD